MGDQLRVLMLEDRPEDAELVMYELRRAGYDTAPTCVDNEADYTSHLDDPLDLILADFHLPQYDAIRALQAMQERGRDIPFIIVSGAIGEELAASAVRLGAADYIIKDRMARLGPAIAAALQAKRLRDENRRTEEALQATQERYERIVETAAEGIAIIGESGIVTFANQRTAAMIGYRVDEIVGKAWRDFVDTAWSETYVESIAILKAGQQQQSDALLRRKDGSELWALAVVADIANEDGSPARLVMLTDITDRKHAEEELHTLSTAIAQSPVGVVITDPAGKAEYVNPRFTEMTGYTAADAVENNPRILLSSEARTEDITDLWNTIGSGRTWRGEYLAKRKDGRLYWEASSIAPVTSPRGTVDHYVAIKEDVTQLKEDQEQIRHQFERIAALRAIDVTINGTLDLQVTLRLLLEQMPVLLGVDTATVLLLNPTSHTLSTTCWRGLRGRAVAPRQVRLGQGSAGRAALDRTLITLRGATDPTCSPEDAALLSEEAATLYCAVPLIAKGTVKGVLELFQRGSSRTETDWLELVGTIAAQAATAIDNATMFDNLQRANAELALAYDATLEGWSRALDLRDNETEGHSQRVTAMSLQIAAKVGMSDREQVHMRRGALLHDIGKLGVPDGILHKPGPLTDEEWEVMRRHPTHAYEMLVPIRFLDSAIEIPYCHHEKWDGSGYPRGLKANTIPLSARIFAIADVYDALTSDRPYRKAWTPSRARAHIVGLSGTQFDPAVVDVFATLSFE